MRLLARLGAQYIARSMLIDEHCWPWLERRALHPNPDDRSCNFTANLDI